MSWTGARVELEDLQKEQLICMAAGLRMFLSAFDLSKSSLRLFKASRVLVSYLIRSCTIANVRSIARSSGIIALGGGSDCGGEMN